MFQLIISLILRVTRPVHGVERVTPDALHIYRRNHKFLGPCCLCPLFWPGTKETHYTEAAIYLPVQGLYKGEYVAECAESKCGYLGKSEDISETTLIMAL